MSLIFKFMLPGEARSEGIGRPVPPGWRAGPAFARLPCSLEPTRRFRRRASQSSCARLGSHLRRGATRRRPRFCLSDCAWAMAESHSDPGVSRPAAMGAMPSRRRVPCSNAWNARNPNGSYIFRHLSGGEQVMRTGDTVRPPIALYGGQMTHCPDWLGELAQWFRWTASSAFGLTSQTVVVAASHWANHDRITDITSRELRVQ